MKRTMGRLVAGVAVAGLVGTFGVTQSTVHADIATANLPVSATVVTKCTIASPNTLAFGDYDPVDTNASTDLDASTTISVACTKGSPNVWVGLGLGANASGTTRRMASGAERLNYELYSDSGYSAVWGNTQATGYTYTAASRAATNLTVYGRVAAGQDVAVGDYNDTVVATINF